MKKILENKVYSVKFGQAPLVLAFCFLMATQLPWETGFVAHLIPQEFVLSVR